jgi:SAM-dependent methyltransferase
LARYAFAAHWVVGRRVIDLCCGLGYGAHILSAVGASRVVGVDISAGAIQYSTREYGSDRVEFVNADVTAAFVASKFDIATCFEGIEHVQHPERLLENIRGLLVPGGIALISTPNGPHYPGGFSGNPYHFKEFSRKEFETLLCSHFESVSLYFQWFHGDPHDFLPVEPKDRTEPQLQRSYLQEPETPPQLDDANQPHPAVDPIDQAFLLRPIPVAYLSTRRFWREEPVVWVAVCRDPYPQRAPGFRTETRDRLARDRTLGAG